MRRLRVGFTLIELLVVIAIIAILAAILFPVFAQAREAARKTACLSNLKQEGSALAMYNQDYDETMPSACAWGKAWSHGSAATLCPPKVNSGSPAYIQEFLVPYVKNEMVWYCPSAGKGKPLAVSNPAVSNMGQNGTSYIWNHETITVPYGPLQGRPSVRVSGLAIAAIPRPAEAPLLWDMPYWAPVPGATCAQASDPRYVSLHMKGINALYADTHAKFAQFQGHRTNGNCLEDWWLDNSWKGFVE